MFESRVSVWLQGNVCRGMATFLGMDVLELHRLHLLFGDVKEDASLREWVGQKR